MIILLYFLENIFLIEVKASDTYTTGVTPSFLVTVERKDIDKEDISFEEILEIEEIKKIVFVGDSRFVGMSQLKECEEIVLAEVGEGYHYFCLLQDSIKSEEADTLVIGFGVNDLHNIKKYVDYVNENFSEIPEIYFLTVNPVDEAKESQYGYSVTNKEIDEFNEYLQEHSGIYEILDTNSYLNDIGFSTKDGIHYTNETYLNIYEYIMENIR